MQHPARINLKINFPMTCRLHLSTQTLHSKIPNGQSFRVVDVTSGDEASWAAETKYCPSGGCDRLRTRPQTTEVLRSSISAESYAIEPPPGCRRPAGVKRPLRLIPVDQRGKCHFTHFLYIPPRCSWDIF